MGAEDCDGVVVGDGRRWEGTLRRPKVMRKGVFQHQWDGRVVRFIAVLYVSDRIDKSADTDRRLWLSMENKAYYAGISIYLCFYVLIHLIHLLPAFSTTQLTTSAYRLVVRLQISFPLI